MPKIMVVDDDFALRQLLTDSLSSQGYVVVCAANGGDALRLVYREQPDLVLVDVIMPGMDGWELVARLRELSNMPVILLTAKSSESDKLRGFRLGVDDYVTKPFSLAELAARIQAVLARARISAPTQPVAISFGEQVCGEEGGREFVLDLRARELRHNGAVVSLTPTEYRLLEYLAQARGRAVSEPELIQKVWGAYRQDETAAVRRYIWMLRQKLESDPSNPRYVLTVRGYGYRLGGEKS